MDNTLGNVIGDSLSLSIGYAERLLAGIDNDQFGRLPHVGEQVIQSNHPAFIYGHLSLYAPKIIANLGGDPMDLPEGFENLFSKDAQCVDDPEQTLYPSRDVIVDAFFGGYRQVLEDIRNASDTVLARDNPTPGRLRELFPKLGSMTAFYVGGHCMIHLGQLSAWRRVMGLAAA